MKDMTSLLCVGANDVRMVGILGMGGMRKTTIAKAIYNEFYRYFEGRNFLGNARETSKQHGLVHLQKQLLSKTLRTSKIEGMEAVEGLALKLPRSKFIPNNFYPRKIVAIDLRYSNLREVWKYPKECTMSRVGNMFSIFLPSDDIPNCFMYKDEGPSVCFEVPYITNLNMAGFVVCTVYSPCASNDNIVSQNLLSISVVNHTKNISQTSRQIIADVVISSKDHLWLGNVSKGLSNQTKDPIHLAKSTTPEPSTARPNYLVVGDGFLPSQTNSGKSSELSTSIIADLRQDLNLHHRSTLISQPPSSPICDSLPFTIVDLQSLPFTISNLRVKDVKAQAWLIKFKRVLHDEGAGPSHSRLEDEPNP
uniref:NB-ARC domain-containing protein n=1 Tax=Quercus lobata TaxID=97700 RepID=A0A7N2NA23_QUELO